MSLTVRLASWAEFGAEARRLREDVFIVEQKVPASLEWDEIDADCLQALVFDAEGNAIGTGRLLPDGSIGRIAVAAASRGQGAGRALIDALVAEARRRGFAATWLNAQTHAKAFYERSGFAATGGEYLEAGIPHVRMELKLA